MNELAALLKQVLPYTKFRTRHGPDRFGREGLCIYVQVEGPEYLSDEELLRRSIFREDELERERDEARESASTSRQAYEEMEEAYRKERTAHQRTKRLAMKLGLAATALFVICALVTWHLLT